MNNLALRRILPLALVCSLAAAGLAVAGSGCPHAAGGSAEGTAYGEHCRFMKGVKKDAKLTDDGAVVTISGKNEKAIGHVKEHLAGHSKGETCKGCPLSLAGVKTQVEINEKGGVITAVGSNPEAVKAIQKWARSKDCCGNCGEAAKKA